MQVKKKPRNAAAKKIHKEPPKEKRTKDALWRRKAGSQ